MAELRKIEVPKPIGDPSGLQFTFLDFMAWLINTQPKFLHDGVGIRVALRVEKKLEELSATLEVRRKENEELEEKKDIWEGLEMQFDEEDHKRIHEAAENPYQGTYPIQPARRLITFLEAIACSSK